MQAVKMRSCMHCERPINGRLDKKFCDDFCRNSYNNLQNSSINNYVRNVNNALRRNRRILKSVMSNDECGNYCSRLDLIAKGFDFRFYTHQQHTTDGILIRFVYEFGYSMLDEETVKLIHQDIAALHRKVSSV